MQILDGFNIYIVNYLQLLGYRNMQCLCSRSDKEKLVLIPEHECTQNLKPDKEELR
jgi:hypothetical protein